MAVEKCFRTNENEKKRSYGNRVLQIENGPFTPLVFASNGVIGKECLRFYKSLVEMIADPNFDCHKQYCNFGMLLPIEIRDQMPEAFEKSQIFTYKRH